MSVSIHEDIINNKKVYCGSCKKYYQVSESNKGSYLDRCLIRIEKQDNWYEQKAVEIFDSYKCSTKNQNNDCKDYEENF
jgi:hypothetical protein